jgi:uncharacterized membrane protein
MVHQITGVEKDDYEAVELSLTGSENKLLGIHADTLSDGRFVVYVSFAPIVNIGQIYLVSKENVKILDIKIKDFMEIISKIGFAADKIYNKSNNISNFKN